MLKIFIQRNQKDNKKEDEAADASFLEAFVR